MTAEQIQYFLDLQSDNADISAIANESNMNVANTAETDDNQPVLSTEPLSTEPAIADDEENVVVPEITLNLEDAVETQRANELETVDETEIVELDEAEFFQMDNDISSIPANSVIDQYLFNIQKKIKSKEITREYIKEHFWVYPKSPYYIRTAADIDPTLLCQPRVFLWFPHYFEKDLKCPEPGCRRKLEIKGYNSKPRARRIIDLHE